MKRLIHLSKTGITRYFYLTCFLSSLLLNTQAQNWQFTQRYTPADVKPDHMFGSAVDIDGNYAIAGAHYQNATINDDTIAQAGTVYLFEKAAEGTWNEVQKLSAPDATAFNYFGIDVGIRGTTAVIGAHYNGTDADFKNPMPAAGAVYVFERNQNGIWEFWQKLTAGDRDTLDWFGKSLKLQQNQLVIAAPGLDEQEVQAVGSVYYFTKNENGYWTEQQKIIPPDKTAYKEFGTAIAYNENYMVIGAPYESGVIKPFALEQYVTNYGSTYIYKKQANETWAFAQKLLSSVGSTRVFGHSVGVLTLNNNETQVLVGHPSNFNKIENVDGLGGAILIYTENDNDEWERTDIIVPTDTILEDPEYRYLSFGSNFIVDSINLIVASGYLKDFVYNIGKIGFYQLNTLHKWDRLQEVEILDSISDIYYGPSGIALSDNDLMLGGPQLFRNSNNPFFSKTGIGHVSFLNSDVMPFIDLPYIVKQQLIYPNPIGNSLHFNTTQFPNLKNIWIVDMQGRQVYNQHTFKTPNQLTFRNSPGVYSIVAQDTKGKVFYQKIIKTK